MNHPFYTVYDILYGSKQHLCDPPQRINFKQVVSRCFSDMEQKYSNIHLKCNNAPLFLLLPQKRKKNKEKISHKTLVALQHKKIRKNCCFSETSWLSALNPG